MPKNAVGARRKVYSAPALEKGLDILEVLAGEADGLTTGEISDRLGKPIGQLFRMLVVLQQREYVAHVSGTDRFGLTMKVFNLGHRLPAIMRLTSAASPLMKTLSQDTHQSCHLVVHYAGKGHVVVQQDAPSARVFSVRLGAEAPVWGSCSGHVLLAFSSPEDRRVMLARRNKGDVKPSRAELESMVNRVIETGFESIASAQIHGVRDVGFPIFDYSRSVVAALVMPYIAYLDESNPVRIDDAIPMVRDAATSISTALGYDPHN